MDSLTDGIGDVDLVIGVDTHKATHAAAVVDVVNGAVGDEIEIRATERGYQHLLDAVPDVPRVWAIEGAGGYGAGLARFLAARGETVVEVERPRRPARRHGAKSDPIDAVRAAREALGRDRQATPKQAGPRAAIAAHLTARSSAVDAATTAQRQLLALAVTAPPALEGRLKGLRTRQLLDVCTRLRGPRDADVETVAAVTVLRTLAKRIRALEAEADEHEAALLALVKSWRPDLLDQVGIGPIVAATLLAAWSHPGRIYSEAAFAMLAGAAPLDASSGKQQRHRLNRFGDRQLNRALHTIVLCRARLDDETKAYFAKKRAEGKTDREIRRCLKRYIARSLYRQLEAGGRPAR